MRAFANRQMFRETVTEHGPEIFHDVLYPAYLHEKNLRGFVGHWYG